MYQTDEALEEPVPLSVLQTIFKSDDFKPEDPVCLDAFSLQNISISSIHYLTLSDLKAIPFPTTLQRVCFLLYFYYIFLFYISFLTLVLTS